jgi:hypothetical protein
MGAGIEQRLAESGATLIRTVVLPAITSEDAAFWPTRPRLQTINELYARN